MLNWNAVVFAGSLIGVLLMPAAAEERKQAFGGTWEAVFKGHVFMTLKIEAGDSMTGMLSGGSIAANEEGDLIAAEGGGSELPISNAKVEDGKLSFDWEDEDGEVSKFVMRISSEGEAELQLVNLPEGVKVKPILLRRR